VRSGNGVLSFLRGVTVVGEAVGTALSDRGDGRRDGRREAWKNSLTAVVLLQSH